MDLLTDFFFDNYRWNMIYVGKILPTYF